MTGFSCQECGYKFRTVRAAEKASTSDEGCPKCGGSDIDLCMTEPKWKIPRSVREDSEDVSLEELQAADEILKRLLGVVVEVF